MQLRLVQQGDAEQIRGIYNHEVANGTNTFDLVVRSVEDQRTWIERHRGAHPAIVAVEGPGTEPGNGAVRRAREETVLGFAVVSPFRDRAAYGTTVEDSVYVHRAHRGGGIGRALLDELLGLAAKQGFHAVIARIASENRPSVALHLACGFESVGTEREVGRKHGRWLDVIELQRML